MDTAIVAAIFGAGGTLIAGLLAAVVNLQRRNGQQHNPSFETLQMLLEQTQTSLESINGKLDQALQDLAVIREKG